MTRSRLHGVGLLWTILGMLGWSACAGHAVLQAAGSHKIFRPFFPHRGLCANTSECFSSLRQLLWRFFHMCCRNVPFEWSFHVYRALKVVDWSPTILVVQVKQWVRCLCLCVCLDKKFWTKTFGTLALLDTISVKFKGQGYRSYFSVAWGNVAISGWCRAITRGGYFGCLNTPEISGKILTSITKGSKLSLHCIQDVRCRFWSLRALTYKWRN